MQRHQDDAKANIVVAGNACGCFIGDNLERVLSRLKIVEEKGSFGLRFRSIGFANKMRQYTRPRHVRTIVQHPYMQFVLVILLYKTVVVSGSNK